MMVVGIRVNPIPESLLNPRMRDLDWPNSNYPWGEGHPPTQAVGAVRRMMVGPSYRNGKGMSFESDQETYWVAVPSVPDPVHSPSFSFSLSLSLSFSLSLTCPPVHCKKPPLSSALIGLAEKDKVCVCACVHEPVATQVNPRFSSLPAVCCCLNCNVKKRVFRCYFFCLAAGWV